MYTDERGSKKMPTSKQFLSFLMNAAEAENAVIEVDTPRMVSVTVVMTRARFEKFIEPHLEETYAADPKNPNDFAGELRGIERVGEHDQPSVQTGGGLYRYHLVIYKF